MFSINSAHCDRQKKAQLKPQRRLSLFQNVVRMREQWDKCVQNEGILKGISGNMSFTAVTF